MKQFRVFIIVTLFAAGALLASFSVARAQNNVQTGDVVAVAAGQTVDSMLFAAGNSVNIAGDVNGDVYCAGQNVDISGHVHGDVFCAGNNLKIGGTVDGSAHLAGQNVSISGLVAGSVTIAAQNFSTDSSSVIGRDLLGATNLATINGSLSRDATLAAKDLIVYGSIGRNLSGTINNFTVGPAGSIGGNLEYTSKNDPVVKSGGKIAGSVNRTAPKAEQKSSSWKAPLAFTLLWFAYLMSAMLLASLVLVLLLPRLFSDATAKAIKAPGRTTLIGFVAVLAAPILIGVLLVSVIGIPLGILALLDWLVTAFFSGPLVAYLLGRLILKDSEQPLVIMLLGSVMLLVLYFIPIIGYFAALAAYIFGVGMFLDEAKSILPGSKLARKS